MQLRNLACCSFASLVMACVTPPRGGASAASGAPGEEPAASPLALRDCPAPPALGVRFVGRFDGCDPSGVRIGWSGTGFVGRFTGTGVAMRHQGPAIEYTVVADGRVVDKVVTMPGQGTFPLVVGLPAGEHTIEVYRRGEASFGAATIQGVEVTDGALLPPPGARARGLEIVGDSITCGYGNEGTSTDCHFSAATEDHYRSYGAVLGRIFDADVSTVAWSGRGVVVNYAGGPGPTLPELYPAAVPTDGPSRWQGDQAPQAVVINLGTNDYSTDADPPDERFVAAYEALLSTIRARYPEAYLLATNGPMLGGADLERARRNIRAAVTRRQQAGDTRVAAHELVTPNTAPGCDWHPSLATHAAMADELARVVAPAVGW
ncbi:MAG TPA: SGNH/GDSL hydrolase family protein [Polyangiaceae bacterium]|nr:SGNH/GDSL hydrolase family protein [Polyangiaceae bacterium]